MLLSCEFSPKAPGRAARQRRPAARMQRGLKKLCAAVVLATQIGLPAAHACTRVLWNSAGQSVIVGRNMDFEMPMPANLWVLPRGQAHRGSPLASSVDWTSKYGSVVVASYDTAVTDGMNEAGLNLNALWLSLSSYGSPREGQGTIATGMVSQYVLDNFGTVAEAVSAFRSGRFALMGARMGLDGQWVVPIVHLAIADASGDSAVIEYVDGAVQIHHGREFTVLTNDPTYSQQLVRLKSYQGLGGKSAIPGTVDPRDRFARAAYYLSGLPAPRSTMESMEEITSVMRNVAQPFRVSGDAKHPDQFPTRWTSIADLTNRRFVLAPVTSPNAVWTNLGSFDLNVGAPVKKVDLAGHPEWSGDVTAHFETVPLYTVKMMAP